MGFNFKNKSTAESLRDMVEKQQNKNTRQPSSVPASLRSEANTIYGFHATSGIGASTIDTEDPTQSEYVSELCTAYRLDWVDGAHVPIALIDAEDNEIEVYVINPTSAEIQPDQMLWGCRPAGTRNGVPVFMALVEDCA